MSHLWHLLAQLGDDDGVVLDGPGPLGEVVYLAQVGVPVEAVQVLRKKRMGIVKLDQGFSI